MSTAGKSSDEKRNPCSFKEKCKVCNSVKFDNRPDGCQLIQCSLYTPCPKCGNNRTIDKGEVMCPFCIQEMKNKPKPLKGDPTKFSEKKMEVSNASGEIILVDDIAPSDHRVVRVAGDRGQIEEKLVTRVAPKISAPGTPPENYDAETKAYYLTQWENYQGFYRDPTCWATVHQIIIMEIELNWWTNYGIQVRGESSELAAKQRSQIIDNLSDLKKMLPSREASKASEAEEALSSIHASYREEVDRRTFVGGKGKKYRMMISPQAMALAPVLPFAINLPDLLRRAGYSVEDSESVLTEMQDFKNLPTDPRRLAKMFHFPIDDEYSLTEENRALFVTPDEEMDDSDLENDDEKKVAELTADPFYNEEE